MATHRQRNLLVTASLPYANGDIHLGHILEYAQADIWVRFQKLQGHRCFYICGSDCHGTPVMLTAQKKRIRPEQLVASMRCHHLKDFANFDIEFDNFHTTHSEENRLLVNEIYRQLKKNGDLELKTIHQAYDSEKQMFLPDRFVIGECPRCHASNQYGDNCEHCGATYNTMDLLNPLSILSNTKPCVKSSQHLFFKLANYEPQLKSWLDGPHLQTPIKNKLKEWLDQGLQSWNISRDAPYFGFAIPDLVNKYFYVWLDAPIGYMASFKDFCRKTCSSNQDAVNFDDYWRADSHTELYHFIGKDVIYFHALFWPAILMATNYRTPTTIHAHGFLTVNGQKMSKSRGTFILAKTYRNHFRADYLRYYFAAKLNQHIEDIDLNFNDFINRCNADLVGKLVNIASRSAVFITKHFDQQLSDSCIAEELWQTITTASQTISEHYEQRNYAKVVRSVMELADLTNQYIEQQAPWQLIKQDGEKQKVQAIATMGLNAFRVLILYLKPIIPGLCQQVESFLAIPPLRWIDHQHFIKNHRINSFKPLIQRITEKEIDAMLHDNQDNQQEKRPTPSAETAPKNEKKSPFKDEITIDDFAKLDLRVATIIEAEAVEKADKLLRLVVNLGGGHKKQLFAGIKSSYKPCDLINKQVVVVANLAPRKMRFGLSEAMILAASNDSGICIIQPADKIEPGSIVR